MSRYSVKVGPGVVGPVAYVYDSKHDECISTYSKRAHGRGFKARAQDDADRLNDSDSRVAFNAAHDDLLPHAESSDYQRDMED
jgi:hypothetical protein